MRLAVLSDIHGNLHALEAVLADLETAGGADRTWVLGDLCFYGAHPAECLARLRGMPHVEFILGNTDRYLTSGQRSPYAAILPKNAEDWPAFLKGAHTREEALLWTLERLDFDAFRFLASLPPAIEMKVPGYGWVIGYHGTPGSDEGVMLPDTPEDELLDHFLEREGRLGFGGHTHLAMDRQAGPWRVVNPGSVGLPREGEGARYALVTFVEDAAQVDLRRVPFDVAAYLEAVRTVGHPDPEGIGRFLVPSPQGNYGETK